MAQRTLLGRMDRRSVLTRSTAAHSQRDFHLESALRIEPNRPDGCQLCCRNRLAGVHKRIGLGWDAQPNESRLSCGAELDDSQMKVYNTAGERGSRIS